MDISRLIVGSIGANCYFLVSKEELAIIDPGGSTQTIFREIEEIEAFPKYIICTHYHSDHTASALEIKKETDAKILIHEKEKKYINFEPDRFLEDGETINIGKESLSVIHTPGHTAGSICLLGKGFILTGDTVFSQGYGRTDLPGGSFEELKLSLEKLRKAFKKGTTVFPGHGESFKVK